MFHQKVGDTSSCITAVIHNILGPFNLTGQWEGVMGAVVTGKHPMSISGWAMYPQRSQILDWCPTLFYSSTLLAMKNQPSSFDFALYVRPFSRHSWFAILTSISILTILMYAPINCNKDGKSDCKSIVKITTWYLFLVLSAYYGGSLTSCFASKPDLPFSSKQDVINAYPGEDKE